MYKGHLDYLLTYINSLFENIFQNHNTRTNKNLYNKKGNSESIYRTFSFKGIYIIIKSIQLLSIIK